MDIRALENEQGVIYTRMTELLAKPRNEKRDFTTEESAEWKRLNESYQQKKQQADVAKTEENNVRDIIADAYQIRAITGKSVDQQLNEQDRYRLAFADWMRQGKGMHERSRAILQRAHNDWPLAVRQQATTPGSAGGFLTNELFSGEIIDALKAFGGMRAYSRSVTTAQGTTMNWPTIDETSVVGQIIGENAAIQQGDMVFGQVQIGAFKYTSDYVLISWELLQDSLVDIVSLVQEKLVSRIGRIQNTHFTNGVGTTEPVGLVPSAATVDADVVSSIDAPDLYRLFHSVDPAYRNDPSCAWMFNDAIAAVIREINTAGATIPLWQPSLTAGVPDRLLGKPIVYNNDMTVTIATTERTMLFGAGNYYLVRDTGGVQVLRLDEINALSGQVTFLAWVRSDGVPLFAETTANEAPIKALLHTT